MSIKDKQSCHQLPLKTIYTTHIFLSINTLCTYIQTIGKQTQNNLPNTKLVIGIVALAMQFGLVSHVVKLSGLVIKAAQCFAMYWLKEQSPS